MTGLYGSGRKGTVAIRPVITDWQLLRA